MSFNKQALKHRDEKHQRGLGLEWRPCIYLQKPLNTVSSATDESLEGLYSLLVGSCAKIPLVSWFLDTFAFTWTLGPGCPSAAIDTVVCATDNRNMGSKVTTSLWSDWFPSHQGLLAPGLRQRVPTQINRAPVHQAPSLAFLACRELAVR